MENFYYCGTCKYRNLGRNEDPCKECFKYGRPIKWEEI